MNIHDAIDAVIFILEGHVILYRSQIVAYMLSARRTGAREHAFSHLFVPKSSTWKKQVTRLERTGKHRPSGRPGAPGLDSKR